MTWARPHVFAAGEMVDAARMNQDIRDNLLALSPSTGEVATLETTLTTTFTDLATAGPSVTVNTLEEATVIISSSVANNTAANFALASYEVSGATTIAASDNWAIRIRSDPANQAVRTTRLMHRTDLTAGSNTFKMKYRASATTATFSGRQIIVIPVGPKV